MAFAKILSPIDFDENSLEALHTTAALARLAGATVFLLHVIPAAAPALTAALVDACVAEEQAARERLAEIAHTHLDGIRFELLTRSGDPAIGIVRTAEEVNADLVVIATHGAHRRPRAFPGSVAERVVRESICPVMTVRPSAAGDPDAVGSHMTPNPLTASPNLSVDAVRQMMTRNRVRSLPVLENDKVVGIVSDRDLAFSGATPDTTIGMLMTREVVAVSPRTSIQEAARLLFECEVEGLPVVEKETFVGFVTRSDVLKAFSGLEPPHAHPLRAVLARRTPTVSRG
jgi:CBS domain-containing protein/nucleotide-binding universal stress UspA family protein